MSVFVFLPSLALFFYPCTFHLTTCAFLAYISIQTQRAKTVVSDSPGLVDFAIGLVNSVFNLPDGQVIFF